jgi:prepilin-type N-terminal cleavage/methylation domain-containing protein
MTRRRGQPAVRSAFTAIEVTIVVLIIGVLTSVGAPRYFESLAHYRIEAAARLVAMDLRMARNYAVRTSSPQTVDFDESAESYAIITLPDPERPSERYSVQLRLRYDVNIHAAAFGAVDLVQFDMYGKPTSSGSVVLRVGSKQRTIEVDAAGQVRIQ